ncbi:alpha/beta fold hydrolase [[Mycobacterium] vasticus]|uniref:Alpha/beta fold hydrolase n=1 Tax=[Mycobacterium] vasticus TaxID=2875777 RepID=A0ABU5Z348_9MYCO|nr:alpha/beta fold hydrolase [Mycolicibacter sp. MYC017]MEB3071280.1 alpha/beta fold hydrolase [Mycolicibacter sp. MYC017]
MSRHTGFATIALAAFLPVAVTLAGCAPGLAADPRFATNSGAGPQGQPESTSDQAGPPPIEAPKNDLGWRDCTARLFGDAAVPATPGVRLDCSSYDADVDPLGGGSSAISIGVVRARSVQTPPDAGPIVFTTGWDMPSSQQLPVWLARSGADVLKSHPILAVDRRGTGLSSPVDCRNRVQRDTMWNQAQFSPGDDPVANLGTVVIEATTDCTDAISPGESSYDNIHAATDLERLRSIFDVPALALMGIGNGAQIALAYAGSHPGKVARLALDSPIALGVAAEAAAEQRIKGEEAALEAFTAQCIAINCPLAPDPKGAINAVLDSARSARSPSGPSAAAVTQAIVTALGYPSGDRVSNTNELGKALAAANSGDANLLNNLINRAQGTVGTDGHFVNVCADALNRPTPDRIRELVVAWGKLYPQFGVVGALDMAQCLSWPSSSAPEPPKDLKIDVLLLGAQNDPIVGEEGVAATAAAVINAGTTSKRVMWQGTGHGAAVYSACTLTPLIGYLDSGKLPDTDVFCPA